MGFRPLAAVLICLVVLGQPSCRGESAGRASRGPIRLVDDAGREIRLSTPPDRIVSLVPSATEILLALGQRDRLVGRTDYDLDPAVHDVTSVGGGLQPSLEMLVSLEPDMVIRFRAESDPETPLRLDAMEIPHVAIRPDRIADVRRIIGLLGTMVQETMRADSLSGAMDGSLEAVSERVSGATPPQVVFLGGNPPTVAGPGTFLHELVELAGGKNAFGDVTELYAPISLEEILSRDVDLILVPVGTTIPQVLSRIPVHRLPLEVLNPGLGVARSAELLGSIFHPDRF